MKVKELKEILTQFDDDIDILIDKSVDGGFEEIRHLTESDIYLDDDNKIIIGYLY